MNGLKNALAVPLIVGLAAALAACGGASEGGRYEIEDTRTVGEMPPWDGKLASSAVRFRHRTARGHDGHGHGGQQMGGRPRGSPIAWELPEGWKELEPNNLRVGNFGIPERPDMECYLTIIPNRGGGVAANINRWRGQMGLGSIEQAEVDALPRAEILGKEAHVVELEGTFGGMGGGTPREGYKMVGMIAEIGTTALFVKMTGPAADVDAERGALDQLVTSLRVKARGENPHGGGDPHAGVPGMDPHAGMGGSGGDDPRGLKWDAPEGWEAGRGGNLRLVTYKAGPKSEVECYVTVLPGPAGGVAANLNLWRQQMGRPELREDEIAALPTLKILGRKSPVVEITGDFKGKEGAPGVGGAMLVGTVCPVGDQTLFIKMVGPVEAVRAERARFDAFCESLR